MTDRNRKDHDRIPPHSNDAEQAVLGALLNDKEVIADVYEIISTPKCFYSPTHAKIFDVIIDMHDKNKAVDMVTIAEEMERRKILGDCGGRTYLAELASGVATSANAVHYANIVFGKYQLRRTIEAAGETIRDCYDQTDEYEQIIDRAEHRIFEIADVKPSVDFVLLSNLMAPAINNLDEICEAGGGLIGNSTGYRDLDDMWSGLKRGELYVLAGRPSMGKSALAENICENHAQRYPDQAVAFFSIEMSKESLAQRALTGKTKISFRDAVRGHIGEREWKRLYAAASEFQELKIYISAPPTLKPIQMMRMLRRLSAKEKIGLVVVDYLQIMTPDRNTENRNQDITQISSKLKGMAKEFNVTVLAISQLSRLTETRSGAKRPQLADLRESGAIEQDADLVAFVYRPEYYMQELGANDPKLLEVQGKAEIITAKQRNGPTGSVWLYFQKKYTRFENLANEDKLPEPVPLGRKDASSGNEPF